MNEGQHFVLRFFCPWLHFVLVRSVTLMLVINMVDWVSLLTKSTRHFRCSNIYDVICLSTTFLDEFYLLVCGPV